MAPIILAADQHLLCWEFTHPPWLCPASALNRTSMGSIPPSLTPWKYQFKKFSLASWPVPQHLSWCPEIKFMQAYNSVRKYSIIFLSTHTFPTEPLYIHTYTCIYTYIHSPIHYWHKSDWMWNLSWIELNCNMQSSQSSKLQNYIRLVKTW